MKNIAYILLIILIASCSDFLKEYSQELSYVRTYKDLDELLLGDVYMEVVTTSHFGSENAAGKYYPYIHVMADETQEVIAVPTNVNSNSFSIQELYYGYYTWQKQVGIDAEELVIRKESEDWDKLYKHINVANMVIASIEEQAGKNDDEKLEISRIKGEAHFLRGAYYFTLVNLYGKPFSKSSSSDLGVPIKTSEFIEDYDYSRNTVQEVYEQILEDLSIAEECLEITERKSIYRADIIAVYNLLSRVYLYMQDWKNAQKYAKLVLEKQSNLYDLNRFTVEKEEEEFFLTTTSPEIIFTMGSGHIASSIHYLAGDLCVAEELYELYEDNDLRKQYFVSDEGYYYALTKYHKNGRYTLSDIFLFRTAEAYLNLAESSAFLNEDSEAVNALNTLRKNRYLDNATSEINYSGENLIHFIRDERRRELCFEGHRWFDLRRYTVSDPYPYSKVIQHTYTVFQYNTSSWPNFYEAIQTKIYELEEYDAAYTLPIPQEVLNFNTNMRNNERPDRQLIEIINY